MADGGIIETLKILIQADDKGLESGVTNAVKKASFSLKNAIGTFVMPVLGALMSGQFIKQTYEEVINLDHLSTSLGVSVERLQVWQGAAKDAGSSAEAVGAMWQRMNAMITDFAVNGTGTLKELAEKGVVPALTTIDGKVKDTDTYLLELSDTLHNMDAQAASGIGRKLGIRDFNLMNFLQQGSGEINQQLKHIKDLGVYTQRDVEIARDFDVALNDVTRVMKMSLVPIFRLVTPLISKLGMALVQLRQHWMVFTPVIALIAGMIMKTLIPSFKALWIDGLKPLLMNPAMWKLAAIAAALALLGLALEDIYVWINGGQSVVGRYLGSWEEFKPAIQPAIDIINQFIEEVKGLLPAFKLTFSEISPILYDVLGAIIKFSAATTKVFLALVSAILEGFILPVIDMFKKFRDGDIQGLIDAFLELPGKIIGALGMAKDAVYNTFIAPVAGWFTDLSAKVRNFNADASSLSVRSGGGGSFDNSQHSTSVVQNNTFNGVKDGQDGANRLMGNNPVSSYNAAYGGTP